MRTNPAAFALSVGMGLIVLLIGFLALNVGGLVSLAPAKAEVAEQPVEAFGCGTERAAAQPVADYTPVAGAERASLVWRTAAQGGDAAAMTSGDVLFKNNCAQCHAVSERVVGPALAGLTTRRRIGWVVSWVKNSSKVVASGDEYAVKLFDDYGKQQMPSFPQLSDKDIKDIVLWASAQQGAGTSCLPSPAVAAN
jgi:mono/diheme cytochrome c family protein